MKTEIGFTGPVNLGNPIEFTIKELAEKIIELTGSDSRIVFMKLPQDDPRQRQPNIELAKSKLGWQSPTQLNEGLKSTIAYFERILVSGHI
jgi:UDP-glucuronate decarboxylase